MRPVKPAFGINSLLLIHIVWLLIPLLYGSEGMKFSSALLVLCCFIVGIYHGTIDGRFLAYAVIVSGAGFILSAIGANTGRIFGSFFFGRNLGVMVFDTPLVMGIFWLLLSYSSSVTASVLTKRRPALNKPVLITLFASVLMLATDLLLERVAAVNDFWYWKNQQAPLQNYTAWFVFAVAFNFLFRKLEIETTNNIAAWFLGLFILLLVCLDFVTTFIFAS